MNNEFKLTPKVRIDADIYARGPKGDKGDKGDKGETGNGILSIEKTGSEGLIDSYTITFTNQETFDFQLKNADINGGYTKFEIDNILANKVTEITQTIENKILEDNKKKYYIGKIIMDTENINPSTYLGFGTWEQWGTGRVPVGVDVNDTDFNTSEKTGGEKTHTLTVEEMPAHIHEIYLDNQSGGYDYSVSAGVKTESGWSSATPVKSIGGNQEHNNIQPYITCYMWKRVS